MVDCVLPGVLRERRGVNARNLACPRLLVGMFRLLPSSCRKWENRIMRQLELFTRSEVAHMRDRTAARNYSPDKEAFRKQHERHRAWGLVERHRERMRHLRSRRAAADSRPSPVPAAQSESSVRAGVGGSSRVPALGCRSSRVPAVGCRSSRVPVAEFEVSRVPVAGPESSRAPVAESGVSRVPVAEPFQPDRADRRGSAGA